MLDSVLDFMPQPQYVLLSSCALDEASLLNFISHSDYVNTIGPLLFRFVLHPDPAISQAACYGISLSSLVCLFALTAHTHACALH
jgi:hypothetical protein